MIDNPGAQRAVGNIYEFVLIASERVREINRERANDGVYLGGINQYKSLEKPHLKACREIVEGKIGREYLKKVGRRIQKNRNNMR
jgi:DNA-directed RNA polymerase subunit K/omega